MLSRVAERVYWMGRYMERLENTARVIKVYSHVMLDLPIGMSPGWDVLLKALSIEPLYEEHYTVHNERNVIKFMLADLDNPGSLMNTITGARENARTTREVFASESWEHINELYYLLKEDAILSIARSKRHQLLTYVIEQCQLFSGLQEGSLNHDHPLRFLLLGRNVERADMTTRLLDVAAAALLERSESPMQFDNLLWMNIIKSFDGLQSYRLRMGPAVNAEDVVEFMVKDPFFPRSIRYSLQALDYNLAKLPRAEDARKSVTRLRNKTRRADAGKLVKKGLHDYLDRIQVDLIGMHETIQSTWFEV